MVRRSLDRLQEPRGEETPGGPAGDGARGGQPLGQEADGVPRRHLTGREGRLGARHHGRVCRRDDQRAVGAGQQRRCKLGE